MAEDIFSKFPDWDNPAYRRYWLKHNLNSELWSDYSGADLRRALASEGRYTSENMFYEVRSYMLAHDERVAAFSALRSDETIPISMHESEPYWSLKSKFLYVLELEAVDEKGNKKLVTRALGSNEQLTPEQLEAEARDRFSSYPQQYAILFSKMSISHAYRR